MAHSSHIGPTAKAPPERSYSPPHRSLPRGSSQFPTLRAGVLQRDNLAVRQVELHAVALDVKGGACAYPRSGARGGRRHLPHQRRLDWAALVVVTLGCMAALTWGPAPS